MTTETLSTFANHIARILAKIFHKPLSMKPYTIQLLPGETIEQASKREEKKVSAHKNIIYQSAGR